MIKVQELFAKETDDRSVGIFMAHQGIRIEWETISPRSPHFGDCGKPKRHLRRIVGLRIFSFEELNTSVIQIQSILNSRTLLAISDRPNNLQPKTPAPFFYCRHSQYRHIE